ncbi:ABC transporter permease subunit [Falsibacillus pallidus]|uniref:Peptide/nickel transport system permease protein n=1 Tax=Falsibacillus pallidus TaxID=493781 RepID=A0A370GE43_9BACI|nr:ABC transporter permease subunit [Falsibacillus pallidus]RDI41947.1 peptide/nickel transport system permease protein [Falsibacillus pallidus]
MKKVLDIAIQFLLSCAGIILVGALPPFIAGLQQKHIDGSLYWQSLKDILYSLVHLNELTYMFVDTERPLFPYMLDPVFYSLTVLLGAFLLAMAVSLAMTMLVTMLPHKLRRAVKLVFYIFESIPDLLIIYGTQLLVIFIFEKTGLLLMDIAALDKQKIYLLPIICLSILPMVQLFRLSMIIFEDELNKDYVLLARSIGLKKLFIVVFHIFPNAVISVFFQSKKTVWFMLSNLLILEFLFNMGGVTLFLMEELNPKIFTITLLAFFFPIFIFYTVVEWILQRKVTGGGTIS